jgi:uncharacterized protein (TIGR04255 family)
MKLPKRITPCPIVDCSLEFRFSSNIPQDAVFGIVYNIVKDEYKKYETLPILQLPEPLRRTDPNLKYKPYYKIYNDTFVIHTGPDVLSISSFPKYVGWDNFLVEISKFLEKVFSISIIKKINRIGMRVINFFPNTEIFSNSRISIKKDDSEINFKNSLFRTDFEHEDHIFSTLNISNNGKINLKNGSIIDIDTFTNKNQDFDIENITAEIEKIHLFEKELFFTSLKEEFIKKFNPEY